MLLPPCTPSYTFGPKRYIIEPKGRQMALRWGSFADEIFKFKVRALRYNNICTFLFNTPLSVETIFILAQTFRIFGERNGLSEEKIFIVVKIVDKYFRL
jgi:hypothetical protein